MFASDNYEEECEWEGPHRHTGISGQDLVRINNVDEDECKKACEDERRFHCVSFDYNFPGRFCFLAKVNRYTASTVTSNDYDYYERNCYGEA